MKQDLSEPLEPAGSSPPATIPAWLSYGSLLLLQFKLIWGIWRFRDLPFGDTGSYFDMAGLWRDGLRVNILWSPLYTAFLGFFRLVSDDAYVATTLHRIVVILLVSVLVLAVARRLLPEPYAWGVAAWWAVLPVHFNALYEVHVFAVLPSLLACLAVLSLAGRRGRGACLGILVASTLLVRNELVVATSLFAVACIVFELRESRWERARPGLLGRSKLILVYGIPIAIAVVVALGLYQRSVVKGPSMRAALESKHTLNNCQTYSFGWKQRHPEWTGDPWNGCGELMTAHFGAPLPTLGQMAARAPERVAEHFLWNLRLTPGGLQLLLFNVMSAPASPDYSWDNPRHPILAWGATGLLALIWICGLAAARRQGVRVFAGPAVWGWIALASVAATALVVIPTQRPRPAYLFSAGIFLAVLSGRFLTLALSRTRFARGEGLRRVGLAAMAAAPLLAPRYYFFKSHHDTERPVLTAVRRLTPFRDLLRQTGTVTMSCGAGWELEGYAGAGFGPGHRAMPMESACPPGVTEDLRACVENAGGTLIYLNEAFRGALLRTEANRAFIETPEAFAWELLAPERTSTEQWLVLKRLRDPAR